MHQLRGKALSAQLPNALPLSAMPPSVLPPSAKQSAHTATEVAAVPNKESSYVAAAVQLDALSGKGIAATSAVPQPCGLPPPIRVLTIHPPTPAIPPPLLASTVLGLNATPSPQIQALERELETIRRTLDEERRAMTGAAELRNAHPRPKSSSCRRRRPPLSTWRRRNWPSSIAASPSASKLADDQERLRAVVLTRSAAWQSQLCERLAARHASPIFCIYETVRS